MSAVASRKPAYCASSFLLLELGNQRKMISEKHLSSSALRQFLQFVIDRLAKARDFEQKLKWVHVILLFLLRKRCRKRGNNIKNVSHVSGTTGKEETTAKTSATSATQGHSCSHHAVLLVIRATQDEFRYAMYQASFAMYSVSSYLIGFFCCAFLTAFSRIRK